MPIKIDKVQHFPLEKKPMFKKVMEYTLKKLPK